MKDAVYTVSQVNTYIKNMFARETILSLIMVKGEVSNCKYHSSGHIYFTIKDEKGQIACVMFAGQRGGLSFRMSEGQSVIVTGSISVYERDGKYQLYARQITEDGLGALYEQFERLKQKLLEEGIFDSGHKKPIKRYNRTVGIVTAKTGAAVQDIIHISQRRNPYVQLVLYPAKVQGEGAAASVVKGIQALDAYGTDVIIIGRGGGSIEDLWAFNEECVARAVYECRTPVISAVGHETDTTIADYAADLRAPTPSAAAELAVCEIEDLFDYFRDCRYTLGLRMDAIVKRRRSELEKYALRLRYADPVSKIRGQRQYLSDIEERLIRLMQERVKEKRQLLAVYIERMKGLSPLERLGRGYGYIALLDGKAVKSIKDVKKGQDVTIDLKDGTLTASIKTITREEKNHG